MRVKTSLPLDIDSLRREMDARTTQPWRSDEWIATGDAWSSLIAARQYRLLFDLMNRYLPADAEILDWGSGSGRFSYALLANGFTVSGFDFVEPPQVALIDEVGGDRFDFTLASDPVTLPYADDRFDAVTSVGVLEHVRDTGGNELDSLAELRRVLRPDGVLICCHLPNRHSWIDAVARRMPTGYSHDFRYRRDEIVRLLDESGFSLVELHRYGALPRNRASRLPGWLRDTRRGADAVDRVDAVAGALLQPFCQNWAFVARLQGSPEARALTSAASAASVASVASTR